MHTFNFIYEKYPTPYTGCKLFSGLGATALNFLFFRAAFE